MTRGFLLDLRWNNIGLLGGRALVNCLPSNRTLWRLELAGNNVPSDVLRAVGKGTQLQAGRRADFLWPRPRLWARGLEGLSLSLIHI